MAIIYSYPIEATPTTSDLLLGTSVADDNKPTKTFTIASLAALVSANAGTGTVTNVATANSTFIDMTGGPISTSGTLQASLSASGTPSNSTFLRCRLLGKPTHGLRLQPRGRRLFLVIVVLL